MHTINIIVITAFSFFQEIIDIANETNEELSEALKKCIDDISKDADGETINWPLSLKPCLAWNSRDCEKNFVHDEVIGTKWDKKTVQRIHVCALCCRLFHG